MGAMSLMGCDLLCARLVNYNSPSQNLNKNMMLPAELKEKIITILNEGKELTLIWNCGGDEAIIDVFIDGKSQPYDGEFISSLCMFITNFMNLPDAGEFAMEGKGKILLENNNIYLECESILKGYEGFTKEGDYLGWVEVNEVEQEYSGKKEILKDKE